MTLKFTKMFAINGDGTLQKLYNTLISLPLLSKLCTHKSSSDDVRELFTQFVRCNLMGLMINFALDISNKFAILRHIAIYWIFFQIYPVSLNQMEMSL